MIIHLRPLVLSAALLLGAAAFAPAVAQPAAPAEPAAAAEPAATAQPAEPAQPAAGGRVAPPPAGKGQVVFFRPSKFPGAAVSFSIHEGDAGVAKLGNGSYAVVVAEPGPHAYTSESESKDILNVEVDAGETQYVSQTLGMGVVMYRPHLTPSDQATFDGLKLKLSTKNPTDLKPKAE
jgi:hypothetical protein